jgi:hypothetical protein
VLGFKPDDMCVIKWLDTWKQQHSGSMASLNSNKARAREQLLGAWWLEQVVSQAVKNCLLVSCVFAFFFSL